MNAPVLSLICLIVALVFFALAAFFGYRYADGSRGWAVAVGLFFFALRDLVGALMLAVVLTLALSPALAYAETVVWDEAADGGIPKGVVGNDGVRCIATATAGGHTYTAIRYIGADADEMSSNPTRERNWQADHCRWINSQEVGGVRGWFKWQHGIEIDPSIIKITIERV